jgi:hypothetical protein
MIFTHGTESVETAEPCFVVNASSKHKLSVRCRNTAACSRSEQTDVGNGNTEVFSAL